MCKGCKKQCEKSTSPVCSKRQITFTNKCHLVNAACDDQKVIFDHEGYCGTYLTAIFQSAIPGLFFILFAVLFILL